MAAPKTTKGRTTVKVSEKGPSKGFTDVQKKVGEEFKQTTGLTLVSATGTRRTFDTKEDYRKAYQSGDWYRVSAKGELFNIAARQGAPTRPHSRRQGFLESIVDDVGSVIQSVIEPLVSPILDPITQAMAGVAKDIGTKVPEDIAEGGLIQAVTAPVVDPIEDVAGAIKAAVPVFTGGGGDTTPATAPAAGAIGAPSDVSATPPGEALSPQALYRRNRLRGATKGVSGTRQTGSRGVKTAALSLAKNTLLGI